MNIGLEQIIWFVVAGVIAYLGFNTGRKVERPKAMEEGRKEATAAIKTQITEQTFERVAEANEAGAAVERRTPDVVRDEASADPYNRGRVQRP